MKRVLCVIILGLYSSFFVGQSICVSTKSYVEDLNVVGKKCVDTSLVKRKGVGRNIIRSNTSGSYNLRKRSYKVRNYRVKRLKESILLKPNIIASVEPFFNVIHSSMINKVPHLYKERIYDFNAVDNLPVFKKCRKIDKEEEFNCFNTEMTNHLMENFKYPIEALLRNVQGKIEVSFHVDTRGKIKNIVAKGGEGTVILKKEAKRIVSLLPKFLAAKRRGKDVAVKYNLVVSFTL